MFFSKRAVAPPTLKKFKLSENAIAFIRRFAKPELNITSRIDDAVLDRIIELATQWEIDMIDPSSDDGVDKTYDYPERERNEMADKFVSEITGQWDDKTLIPDLDDLNARLHLD